MPYELLNNEGNISIELPNDSIHGTHMHSFASTCMQIHYTSTLWQVIPKKLCLKHLNKAEWVPWVKYSIHSLSLDNLVKKENFYTMISFPRQKRDEQSNYEKKMGTNSDTNNS